MSEDDTRTRILNAAGLAFAEKGFQAATVREICSDAGVNAAAINYHFGDKERLYVEALKHAHRFRIEQVPMPEWPAGTPAEERLRGFIGTLLTRMLTVEELPWQEALMMREMFQPTGACRELVEDIFRPHLRMLLGILDELLPDSTPLHTRHQCSFSIVGQCLFYRFHQKMMDMLVPIDELTAHYSPDTLADHITGLTLRGLHDIGRSHEPALFADQPSIEEARP